MCDPYPISISEYHSFSLCLSLAPVASIYAFSLSLSLQLLRFMHSLYLSLYLQLLRFMHSLSLSLSSYIDSIHKKRGPLGLWFDPDPAHTPTRLMKDGGGSSGAKLLEGDELIVVNGTFSVFFFFYLCLSLSFHYVCSLFLSLSLLSPSFPPSTVQTSSLCTLITVYLLKPSPS